MLPSSFWNAAIWALVRCFFQLKDGEQLYASSLRGNLACTASAKQRASSMSGFEVSNHKRSAYSAYARARAIAASTPLLTWKNPSVVRSPVRKRRAYSVPSLVSRGAGLGSVRATRTVSTPPTAARRRAAVGFWVNFPAGPNPLPAHAPPLFHPASV